MYRNIRLTLLAALIGASATAIGQPIDGAPKFFEHMLQKWDANGDGKLTPAELSFAGKHAQTGQHRFDKLDSNHNGVITLNEYVAAANTEFTQLDSAGNGRVTAEQIANSPKAHERAQRVAEHVAKRLDTNADGVVSKEEFLAAARQRFARLDKNGDGCISVDEIGQRHWARDGVPLGHQ